MWSVRVIYSVTIASPKRQVAAGKTDKRTSSQWLRLDRESNLDSILFLALAQQGDHNFRSIVDSKNDILDAGLLFVDSTIRNGEQERMRV